MAPVWVGAAILLTMRIATVASAPCYKSDLNEDKPSLEKIIASMKEAFNWISMKDINGKDAVLILGDAHHALSGLKTSEAVYQDWIKHLDHPNIYDDELNRWFVEMDSFNFPVCDISSNLIQSFVNKLVFDRVNRVKIAIVMNGLDLYNWLPQNMIKRLYKILDITNGNWSEFEKSIGVIVVDKRRANYLHTVESKLIARVVEQELYAVVRPNRIDDIHELDKLLFEKLEFSAPLKRVGVEARRKTQDFVVRNFYLEPYLPYLLYFTSLAFNGTYDHCVGCFSLRGCKNYSNCCSSFSKIPGPNLPEGVAFGLSEHDLKFGLEAIDFFKRVIAGPDHTFELMKCNPWIDYLNSLRYSYKWLRS